MKTKHLILSDGTQNGAALSSTKLRPAGRRAQAAKLVQGGSELDQALKKGRRGSDDRRLFPDIVRSSSSYSRRPRNQISLQSWSRFENAACRRPPKGVQVPLRATADDFEYLDGVEEAMEGTAKTGAKHMIPRRDWL